MKSFMQFGLPDVPLNRADHICALFRGTAQRDQMLQPYLEAGIEAGDKCLVVTDRDVSEMLASMEERIDVAELVSSGQLEFRTSPETYLRTGRFSGEDMNGFWDESVGAALRGGRFRFARIAAEATWLMRQLSAREDWLLYESSINRMAADNPRSVFCMYDLDVFGGGMVVDLLKTHPRVLLCGLPIDNPFYLSPDEFVAARLQDRQRPSAGKEGPGDR